MVRARLCKMVEYSDEVRKLIRGQDDYYLAVQIENQALSGSEGWKAGDRVKIIIQIEREQ